MRSIDPALKVLQNAQSQNPTFKVMRKPSEASIDAYEDITHLVKSADIQINGEGTPNSAVLNVVSTKGAYDIFNVKSLTRKHFRKGTKIQVYAGFQSSFQLLFTGYVVNFFEQRYEKGKAETVSIKLGDKGYGDGKISYRKKITTREYYIKEPGDPNYGDTPAGNESNFWTIKEIIEDVLVRYGGMSIDDIFVDEELDYSLLGNYLDENASYRGAVQFIEESIWDILQLCCEVKRHVGYFDENGQFRTKPLQFTVSDFIEGTAVSGTFNKEIDHYIADDDIQAQMTVIGGVKFAGRRAEKTVVINVDPYAGIHAIKAQFETETNGTGHTNWLDSLYGQWDAANNDKFYGIGFQGTCVPVDGNGIVEPPYDQPPFGDPDRSNYNTWFLTVAGPFKFTLDGIPNEPYQVPKTGLGDGADMGATGFFTKYNIDGGTNVTIDPDTLAYDPDVPGSSGQGRHWPEAIGDMFGDFYQANFTNPPLGYSEPRSIISHRFGVLPSRQQWSNDWLNAFHNEGFPPDFPYPEAIIAASNAPGYDGPDDDEYFIFMATHTDYLKYWFAVKFQYFEDRWRWQQMEVWFHRVFQWGITMAADWTELPLEHFTGTSIDGELVDYYGTDQAEEFENPLIFSDPECELLGSMTIDRLRKFHGQAKFERPLNLELEIGDLIEIYNERTGCTEKVSNS